jgi:hypothetical protein
MLSVAKHLGKLCETLRFTQGDKLETSFKAKVLNWIKYHASTIEMRHHFAGEQFPGLAIVLHETANESLYADVAKLSDQLNRLRWRKSITTKLIGHA